MFIGIYYCLKEMFNDLLKVQIKDITFGYCLNLTFKDEYQNFDLRKMSLGNM